MLSKKVIEIEIEMVRLNKPMDWLLLNLCEFPECIVDIIMDYCVVNYMKMKFIPDFHAYCASIYHDQIICLTEPNQEIRIKLIHEIYNRMMTDRSGRYIIINDNQLRCMMIKMMYEYISFNSHCFVIFSPQLQSLLEIDDIIWPFCTKQKYHNYLCNQYPEYKNRF